MRCCSLPVTVLFHIQVSAPGRSLQEAMGANGSATEATGGAEETCRAEIELRWLSGQLASAARELKEAVSGGGAPEWQPIGCSDCSLSRQAADQSTAWDADSTPQRRASSYGRPRLPAKSAIALYSRDRPAPSLMTPLLKIPRRRKRPCFAVLQFCSRKP